MPPEHMLAFSSSSQRTVGHLFPPTDLYFILAKTEICSQQKTTQPTAGLQTDLRKEVKDNGLSSSLINP